MNEFKIGDKVIKNLNTWIINEFDGWGRGLSEGIIVDVFKDSEQYVDVRWPAGRCYENLRELIKIKNNG